MTSQPRKRWLAGVLYLCATVLLCPPESSAQFEAVWAPDRASSEGEIALFARWSGDAADADGAHVRLPRDWTLQRAQAVFPTGAVEPLTVITRPDADYFAIAGFPSRSFTLIVHVATGPNIGTQAWSLAPYVEEEDEEVLLENHRLLQYTVLEDDVPGAGRLVLSFHERDADLGQSLGADLNASLDENAPLLLRSTVLPDLGSRAPHTIAFWMQATGTNEVVISTWDGNEESSYPLEFMVDAWGHLRYYRGEPGRHQSMVTNRPVADGEWHHIALAHDPDSGWTRLLHDGIAVDSLYAGTPLDLTFETPLALGARIGGGDRQNAYSGRLAALHLWPVSHSIADVRSRMRQQRSATRQPSRSAPVFVEFDEPLAQALVEQAPQRVRRVTGTLLLDEPLRNLRASVEDRGVRLRWEAEGRATNSFVVERSNDGIAFDSVGHVQVTPGTRDSETAEFSFQDDNVRDQVVYYRVRQHFRDGPEYLSGSIKLGLGTAGDEELSALLGNFPNPFRDETIIAFELLERDHVRLSVWDLTGQRVALLLDEAIDPGYHEIPFDGYNLPSGTYFVRLQTSENQHTRSMTLAK